MFSKFFFVIFFGIALSSCSVYSKNIAEINKSVRKEKNIIICITSRLGTPFSFIREKLIMELGKSGYGSDQIVEIRVGDLILENSTKYKQGKQAKGSDIYKYYSILFDAAEELKMRKTSIHQLIIEKIEKEKKIRKQKNKPLVFIVNVIKGFKDIQELRNKYGDDLYLVCVYTTQLARLKNLAQKMKELGVNQSVELNSIKITELEEKKIPSLNETFADGDFYISSFIPNQLNTKISRFVNLMFDNPYISPTVDEQGIFFAFMSKLRSIDLSRQVGSVIMNDRGSMISTGVNGTPRAGGGLYWEHDEDDRRDYTRGKDTSKIILSGMKNSLLNSLRSKKVKISKEQLHTALKESQFLNIIEFVRSSHAEMAAIGDAAMYGKQLLGSTIYVTTFPCHLCTRMIILSGIKRAVFIETYAKSRARELYGDSISINQEPGMDSGKVRFDLFEGVGPRRYSQFFRQKKRKDDRDKVIPFKVPNHGKSI